jgi:hypothetical protein
VAFAAGAQQSVGQKQRYVLVPPELALITVASQPDCPLQFEDVKVLASVDGGVGGPDFRLRNRSSKPIRDLRYEWWTTEYSGAGGAWPRKVTSEVVMPGQLVPEGEEADKYEIIPLTEELRDKLKLRGPMRGVAILMVVKVTFADGTTYNAEPTLKALRAYVARLAGFDDEDVKTPKK